MQTTTFGKLSKEIAVLESDKTVLREENADLRKRLEESEMNELDKHIDPEIHAHLNELLRDENADLRRQIGDLKIDLQMSNEENADLRAQLAQERSVDNADTE